MGNDDFTLSEETNMHSVYVQTCSAFPIDKIAILTGSQSVEGLVICFMLQSQLVVSLC